MFMSYFEYLVQLIVRFPNTGEGGHSGDHLDEDAADAPHVEWGGVVGGAQQDVGRAVPQRHNLMWVRVWRHRLGAG